MNNIYIYVVNRRTPSKTTKGKWDTYEEVSIKHKIHNKLYDSAVFVIDVMNMKLEKNRYEHSTEKEYTFDNVMSYLSKQHEMVRNLYTEIKTIRDAVDQIEKNALELEEKEQETGV